MKLTGAFACVLFAVGCGGGGSKKPTTPAPDPTPVGEVSEPKPTPDPTPEAKAEPAPTTKSLYDRLGGLPAIQAVVGEFVARVAADNRINQRFFNTDIENLKKLLTEFVCGATGGPCKYTGRSMGETHGGMELVDDEFNALVEDLIAALDKFKVPEKEKGELLGALGPLKPQIVVEADKLKPIEQPKLDAATKVASGVKDKNAQDLLNLAITAGKRGQRNYAEQLFTRAEMITGPKPLATIATTFRKGAPPRITTALKTMPKDTAPQPETVGNSDQDNPDKKPAGGTLHGTLRLDGKALNGLGVIQLWPDKGGSKRVAKFRVIEQRNKVFAPHVMAVPVGSTVSFPNFDPIFHNVFSLSKVKAFDLGMYKNGETREIKVDKPGIIRLGCNLHANMSAYVVVVDAPHYAVVGEDGSFKFSSLKPGKYKVQGWSEQSGEPSTTTVEVKAGDNEANLDLKAGAGPGVSPDKFGTSR
jgi:hemoglobin